MPSIVRVVVRHLSETVLLYSGRILAVETSKPTLSITTELGVTYPLRTESLDNIVWGASLCLRDWILVVNYRGIPLSEKIPPKR